jgi:hypothetical protein
LGLHTFTFVPVVPKLLGLPLSCSVDAWVREIDAVARVVVSALVMLSLKAVMCLRAGFRSRGL